MAVPIDASALEAGTLISKSRFMIPSYQRDYSWEVDDVRELWEDLKASLDEKSYFLGLIILTRKDDTNVMDVVDGQQRLVTLTLLAKAMHNSAKNMERKALADRIESALLRHLDYETDTKLPRITFSDPDDNLTFRSILNDESTEDFQISSDLVSRRMIDSFENLSKWLDEYLGDNAFKLLGKLAEFIIDRLYFAVFTHPDDESAYTIFEVINTRGKVLTTADLLKNYILSKGQNEEEKTKFYDEWQYIAKEFASRTSGSGTLVQYIKHAVNVDYGHISGKDLYSFLSDRRGLGKSPSPPDLLNLLSERLDLYCQIDTPTRAGPVSGRAIEIFSAFNSLGVLTVRPILLALSGIEDDQSRVEGMEYLLRLVVRRMVVGNIGVGIVERQFSEAAKAISVSKSWDFLRNNLVDFNQTKEEFRNQLVKRSFNKKTLTFVRQSAIQGTITPKMEGHLHWIWPKRPTWNSLKGEHAYWVSTLGNSILANASSRTRRSSESWGAFKETLMNDAIENEVNATLEKYDEWDASSIETVGQHVAEMAAQVWY